MENKTQSTGYTGKIKTGSQRAKKKFDTPKTIVTITEYAEKKPRKSKNPTRSNLSHTRWNDENLSQLWSETNNPSSFHQHQSEIPKWIKESSKEKPVRKSSQKEESQVVESKLQWRKVSKKSQRSFSKNKEREYLSSKPWFEKDTEIARGPFSNTFEKKSYNELGAKQSSWNTKSKKPGTGFEKSKTGYKGVETPWNKSTAPKKSTRTWDDDSKKSTKNYDEKQKKSFPKSSFEKKTEKPTLNKPTYTAPKRTWEKETDSRDKKKIKDPTK